MVLSFISFLHQTTTSCSRNDNRLHCLLSLFYIKPQRAEQKHEEAENCLLSLFYIKPQPEVQRRSVGPNCLLSLFYIKPQPSKSTIHIPAIIFYLFSTSNHNHPYPSLQPLQLSFISFLHQTTTIGTVLFSSGKSL